MVTLMDDAFLQDLDPSPSLFPRGEFASVDGDGDDSGGFVPGVAGSVFALSPGLVSSGSVCASAAPEAGAGGAGGCRVFSSPVIACSPLLGPGGTAVCGAAQAEEEPAGGGGGESEENAEEEGEEDAEENEEEEDDASLTQKELEMKRQAGCVWIPVAVLRRLDRAALRARQAALPCGALTAGQRAVLEWQRQRVKNREGAAHNRARARALRDAAARREAETAALRAELARLRAENAALRAALARVHAVHAPVAPPVAAPVPVAHAASYTPVHAPAARKRPRLRTPALFFFGMLALLVLVAQLTVLEARTNPASAHPLARTFRVPPTNATEPIGA